MTTYIERSALDNNGHRMFVTERLASVQSLSDIMDFDHVIRVYPDGVITDDEKLYAPEVTDGALCDVGGTDDGWTLLDGYSGQSGYSGPIMHSSEFIGGGMADRILSNPGYYVAVIARDSCTDECNEDECGGEHYDGWAVAFKPLD